MDECSCADSVWLRIGMEGVMEDIDGEVVNDDEDCTEDEAGNRAPEDFTETGGESSSFVESSEYARRDVGARSKCIDVPGNVVEDERALLLCEDDSDIVGCRLMLLSVPWAL